MGIFLFKGANEDGGGRKDVSCEAVSSFLKHNPNLSDDRFHEWAERKGYHVPSAERKAYKMAHRYANIVQGGKSKNKMPKGVDPNEVKQGVAVEKEHTKDPDVARKIVKDHMEEIPRGYYKGLHVFEKTMKKLSFTEAFIDEFDKIAMCGKPHGKKKKMRKV